MKVASIAIIMKLIHLVKLLKKVFMLMVMQRATVGTFKKIQ